MVVGVRLSAFKSGIHFLQEHQSRRALIFPFFFTLKMSFNFKLWHF